MVGWLIEHHNVEVFGQQRSQGNSSALATAQFTDRFRPVEVVEQATDDIAHLGVAGPYVFGLFANHGLSDSHGWVEGVTLVEHSDAQITAMSHATAVWLEGLRENLHERRFTIAVSTDDADSIAVVDADGHRLENFFRRKLK